MIRIFFLLKNLESNGTNKKKTKKVPRLIAWQLMGIKYAELWIDKMIIGTRRKKLLLFFKRLFHGLFSFYPFPSFSVS